MTALTPNVLHTFSLARIFRENLNRINSGDFYRDGSVFVAASDDQSLSIFDAAEGSLKATIRVQKYGVDCVRFTHNRDAIIHASKNGWDETIRYLGLHDQKYVRYFRGHRDRVTSLKMCPVSDSFLSASMDGSARLWDLRSNACRGKLQGGATPCVAFDPEGLVFGVACSDEVEQVKMYDVRSFEGGPFSSWRVPSNGALSFADVSFSNDGAHLLLHTQDGVTFMLDAYEGHLEHEFRGYKNEFGSTVQASFSPDAQYVSIGSEDGSVLVWSVANPSQEPVKWTGHGDPVSVALWNPKMLQFVSGAETVAMWLPRRSAVDAA